MNLTTFYDFLYSFYIEEVEQVKRLNVQEQLARMVFEGGFGNDITNSHEMAESNRRQAMRTARAVKASGKGVVKVVHRCDEAKESQTLDLSECQLIQVPDAIYHLMKEIPILSCNLSGNLINKIQAKLCMKFTTITELNIANNRISTLPDELASCTTLETINIAANSFIQLPPVLGEIPSLIKIVASKNFIANVEVEAVTYMPNLEHIDLQDNPLKKEVYESLAGMTSLRVVLSPREQEEWEDLSI